MKLYIPEIGDSIILEKDWTFTLHQESRNDTLAAFFGYYPVMYRIGGWIHNEDLVPMRDPDYVVKYPERQTGRNSIFERGESYEEYEAKCEKARQENPEYVKWHKDMEEWVEKAEKLAKESIEVTLPAGTELSVDRIYIRKGASEYSSITFYAKRLPEITYTGKRWHYGSSKPKKIKAFRFWAKLADCNQIEFT